MYSSGFVVKTPKATFGFDLNNFFGNEEFLELAELIDVLFISHPHLDHLSEDIIEAVKDLGKDVVGPSPTG